MGNDISRLIFSSFTESDHMLYIGKCYEKRNHLCTMHSQGEEKQNDTCTCHILECTFCGKYFHNICGDIESIEFIPDTLHIWDKETQQYDVIKTSLVLNRKTIIPCQSMHPQVTFRQCFKNKYLKLLLRDSDPDSDIDQDLEKNPEVIEKIINEYLDPEVTN